MARRAWTFIQDGDQWKALEWLDGVLVSVEFDPRVDYTDREPFIDEPRLGVMSGRVIVCAAATPEALMEILPWMKGEESPDASPGD